VTADATPDDVDIDSVTLAAAASARCQQATAQRPVPPTLMSGTQLCQCLDYGSLCLSPRRKCQTLL